MVIVTFRRSYQCPCDVSKDAGSTMVTSSICNDANGLWQLKLLNTATDGWGISESITPSVFARRRNAKQAGSAQAAVVTRRRDTEEEMRAEAKRTSHCEFLPVHILSNKSLRSERGESGSACCALRAEG